MSVHAVVVWVILHCGALVSGIVALRLLALVSGWCVVQCWWESHKINLNCSVQIGCFLERSRENTRRWQTVCVCVCNNYISSKRWWMIKVSICSLRQPLIWHHDALSVSCSLCVAITAITAYLHLYVAVRQKSARFTAESPPRAPRAGWEEDDKRMGDNRESGRGGTGILWVNHRNMIDLQTARISAP